MRARSGILARITCGMAAAFALASPDGTVAQATEPSPSAAARMDAQVVATVNGDAITLDELNREIAELNMPPAVDKARVRAEVLQRMIDRCLLAQAAKDDGIDQEPDYVSQASNAPDRRARERLLVSTYGKKTFEAIPVPDTGRIDQYIAAHPTLFGARRLYKLNQVVFDMPADPKMLQPLGPLHSMSGITAWLSKKGIKFVRGVNTLDSANVPVDVMARIEALPAGEPFIVPNNGKVVVSVITSSEPVQMVMDQARPIAVQAIRRDELNRIGEERLKNAKAKARIEYRPGYAPSPAN